MAIVKVANTGERGVDIALVCSTLVPIDETEVIQRERDLHLLNRFIGSTDVDSSSVSGRRNPIENAHVFNGFVEIDFLHLFPAHTVRQRLLNRHRYINASCAFDIPLFA